MEGVDYSFSRPDPEGLRSAGKRFAMRYIGPGTSPKHLTVGEFKALQRAGLSLVTLVEGSTGDPKQGFSAGVSHARSAVAMLKARGFPVIRPMYFAIDYDTAVNSWPAAREYLRGAGSIIGENLVGVYGEYDVMVWANRDNVAEWFFQTYAWSGGRWYPGNHVEQYKNGQKVAGADVDLCRSMKDDFGQWGQQSAPTPPQTGDKDVEWRIAEISVPAENEKPASKHWVVGNGIHYRNILTWPEHEDLIKGGAIERKYTVDADWSGWVGRTYAETAPGGGTTVEVTQDMLNAAVAANVDAIAAALAKRFKIL